MSTKDMNSSDAIEKMMKLGFSEQHATVYVRARGRCEYCGIDLIRDRMSYAGIQIDHILPVSKHQNYDTDNLALSCTICNSIKSNWAPDESSILNASREAVINIVSQYISKRIDSHDETWLGVNRALRSIWWQTKT